MMESEDLFSRLFQNTPNVAIQGFGPDGTVHYWNPASEELYGYSAEEAIGRNLLDLIIPEGMQDEVRSAIAESGRSGRPIPAEELVLRRKDGTPVEVHSSHTVVHSADGTPELFCLDLDISERKRTQAALDRREREYRLLVENQTDLVVKVDAEGRFEFVSESYCRLFGKAREELLGQSFVPLVHEDDLADTMAAMQQLYTPPYRCHVVQRAMTKDGWRWLEWEDSAVVDEDGNVTAIVASGRDITRRKHAEEQLQASEERLRTILELLPLPAVISEGHSERVLMVNRKFPDVFGYTIEDIPDAEAWFRQAYPDEGYRREVTAEWQRRMADAAEGARGLETMEVTITCKDGSVRYVAVHGYSVGDLHIIVFVDLTEINSIQRQLEQSVEDKDRLMRELNHRVKNNLNMVSSLINLKDAGLGDATDLSDIRNQIRAIAFIHEKLYETEDIAHIDFAAYARRLLPSVFSFYAGAEVTVEYGIESILLPTRTAVELGLIVNELATNAIKHGFTHDVQPRFGVSMTESVPDSTYVLTVSNNGRPFPRDFDIESPGSMGLQLVSALVEQLHGTLELRRAPSPVFTVQFPVPE